MKTKTVQIEFVDPTRTELTFYHGDDKVGETKVFEGKAPKRLQFFADKFPKDETKLEGVTKMLSDDGKE